MSSIQDRFTFEDVRRCMDSAHTDWTQDPTEDIFGPVDFEQGVDHCTLTWAHPDKRRVFPNKEAALNYLEPFMTGSEMRGFVDTLEAEYRKELRPHGWHLMTFVFALWHREEPYAMLFLKPSDPARVQRGERVLLIVDKQAFKGGIRRRADEGYECVSRQDVLDFVRKG